MSGSFLAFLMVAAVFVSILIGIFLANRSTRSTDETKKPPPPPAR